MRVAQRVALTVFWTVIFVVELGLDLLVGLPGLAALVQCVSESTTEAKTPAVAVAVASPLSGLRRAPPGGRVSSTARWTNPRPSSRASLRERTRALMSPSAFRISWKRATEAVYRNVRISTDHLPNTVRAMRMFSLA